MIHNPFHQTETIALTVDTLIFSISSTVPLDTRKLSDKHLNILLVKRFKEPYKEQWCLPGGFVKSNETLEDAAERVLTKETNLTNIYKEQLQAFSEINRDPRARIVSMAYLSLVDAGRLQNTLDEQAAWFRVELKEQGDNVYLSLSNDTSILCEFTRKHDSITDTWKYKPRGGSLLAFDHAQMIMVGLENLRRRVSSTNIVFNMLPDMFTLGELQQVHEVILGRALWTPAFRRTITDKVAKTKHTVKTGGHRPSVLYRYIRKENI